MDADGDVISIAQLLKTSEKCNFKIDRLVNQHQLKNIEEVYPALFNAQKSLGIAIPFCGLIASILLYSFSPIAFWRVFAYVAVFHFIRQQYVFMRVYSRKDKSNKYSAIIDTITIYVATVYPIIYWHLSGPPNFNWFVKVIFSTAMAECLVC